MDRPITSRLFLLLLSVVFLCASAAPCPRSCACPQPTELHCTFRSLFSVPNNVHRAVERINLGFNSISKLSEKSLSGLTRLELLLIHGNDLHTLPDGAFKDLRALQMLKLSYNKLREVNRYTFHGLWSLARLHLDNNRLEFIDPDAFHGLTSLRLLQLEGNRLRQIHPSTFTTFTLMDRFHLSTLKHLYLSNNSLSAMSRETLERMPQLENLFLHGNPWICDCNMRWMHSWVQTAPGVLKCKKDRALPGGQLCPMCSSPRNLCQKPLQALDNMICSSPVINSEDEHRRPEETDSEFTFWDDFRLQFGNVSLGLSDEHGNEVELECSIDAPREINKISFEHFDDARMASNLTLSLDLDCDMDRERYERLWRLIAYYSSIPAHLKRGIMLTKDPSPTYVYKQDSDKDALYYTGVKANIMAQPFWLMQKYADLQLNRQGSSGKKARLILTMQLSQNLEVEMIRRQVRTWVVIEATNSTRKMAILGKTVALQCNVQSSGEPRITWMLPDGTKLVAPSRNPDERLSISADGRLVIKVAEHKDAGNYYCVAKVEEDFATLAFFLTVQDFSHPQPGADQSNMPLQLFAGSSLNLNCSAFGSPDPEVNWILPNGNIVGFWSNTSRAFVYSNGTLHISQSLLTDNGFYKCVALNQYGMDTKAVKVIVNRRPGIARPLRKIPVRLQSVSGVNTKIQVEMKELGEGSGDEEDVSDAKPVRKIIPVQNGAQPSRNTRRRPLVMVRKQTLQNGENGKNILDNRWRVNMGKTKINPEKWADILAKIRVKNGQFLTMASPILVTTPQITTQFTVDTTLGQEEYPFAPDPTTLAQEVIEGSSDGVTLHDKVTTTPLFEQKNSHSLPTTTPQPSTLQSFPYLQHTTSSNEFFLPQTTSAPLQAVTFWQASPNTQSKSMTYPRRENGDKPADTKRLKATGKHKNKARISKLKKVKGRQEAPTVDPVTSNKDEKMKLSKTVNKPKDFSQLEAILTMVSPTTVLTQNRQGQSVTRQPNSKRRNGNRKKRPNGHKQKLNKNMGSITKTPGSQITAQPTSSTGLKIDNLNTVTASLVPIDPLWEVQKTTASRMSHKASTESYLKSPQTTFFQSTAAQCFFPTAFPNAVGTRLNRTRSKSRRKFASLPLPPVKPLAQTPIIKNTTADFNLASHSYSSSEGLRHANGKLIHENTTPKGKKHLVKGTREHFARRSSSVASLTEHKVEEMRQLSSTSGLMSTASLEFAVQAVTKRPEIYSFQNERPNNVEDLNIIPSPTSLPRFTSHFAAPELATSSPMLSTKDAPSISTKKKLSQSESVFSADLGITKTTVTPYLTALTNHTSSINFRTKIYNWDQQTKTSISNSPEKSNTTNSISLQIDNVKTTKAPSKVQHTTQQMTGIRISTRIDDQKPQSKIKSAISLDKTTSMWKDTTQPPPGSQHENQTKLPTMSQNAVPKTTTTHLLLKSTTNKTPSISIHPNYDNEANELVDTIVKTTIRPSKLQYRTQQVPSISSRNIKLDQNIQTKLSNSSLDGIQNSTASQPTQHASFSISYKPDQNSETELVTADTTQQTTQPPPKFKDFVTQSSNHKLDLFISTKPSILTIKPRTTPGQTFTPFIPTEPPQARTTPKLPAAATDPRGKPRITKGNFQTVSVKAETDAMLPCAAVGEPKPFLSWTKVSTGTSIPQNTRLQRFEVHKNGTLIVRNTQPFDGGEYLCTVQNQYGSDQVLTNLVVLSQHPKILQPRHRDISVNLGSRVELDCQVEGHPKPRITWVLPTHAQIAATPFGLASSNHVTILRNGTLRIIQAGFSDRGIYKCVGSSTAGADTVSIRLYVTALPPVFQQMPNENITATENGVIYLHCAANGSPQPTIRWTTPDNIQLISSQYMNGRRIMVYPNGTLFMQSLSQGNTGKYECVASNVMGTSKRTVNLSVKSNMLMDKASITSSSPKLTEVVYGAELTLNCVAKGDPEPRLIWRTPSKKLLDAQYSFDPRIKVYPNGSLTVHSVTDKDGGDYFCVARNKIGDDYIVLGVEVLTRPAKIVQKQQRPSQEVVYGGDLKVDCVASGLPNPEISWALPDGTMVNNEMQRQSGGRSRRYVVFDNGTLFFNDVGMREEGDYTCYAENQLGKDEMKIHVKVKALSSPPQIQNKTQTSPTRVFYGETLTLRCSAKGEPAPTFTWISPTNRLIASNKEKYQDLNDGTLVVQKVQRFDAGDYTCKARNSAGQDSKIIKVEVLVTPPVISNSLGSNFKVSTNQDERILLDCVANGTPTPRIMWVLPGNVILPAPYYSNRMTVFQNGTLEIHSPKKSDSGQLACIARNEGGEVRLSVSLEVKDANARVHVSGPEIETVSLTVGNAMTLNCSFGGNNLPQVTWVLPNGKPLLSGVSFTKFFHRQDGSLMISNPSIAETGTYRCLGRYNGGQVEQIVQLMAGRKPEIANRYIAPINIMNGETLMLHCVTNGESVRLTWTLPSGVLLNRPQKAGRYSVLHNGTLAIQHVSFYDRGLYVCRAANEYGNSVMSVSVIVIAYPPRITNGPPSVSYAKRGVAVQLNCAATGIPNVEIAWETPDKTRLVVNSQPRLFGNKYLHPQGSLVIQNPMQRDAGVYRCTAKNAIGVDTKATYLNVY